MQEMLSRMGAGEDPEAHARRDEWERTSAAE
jgi:hypothetical protein